MTYPTGPRRYAHETTEPPTSDPLTDSGIHRLMLGTRVTLHMHRGEPVEVALTTIRDVTTWNDLVDRVANNLPIVITASRRRVFSGGVVLWAEVASDPLEQTPRT
jgi:hypothetical protein